MTIMAKSTQKLRQTKPKRQVPSDRAMACWCYGHGNDSGARGDKLIPSMATTADDNFPLPLK